MRRPKEGRALTPSEQLKILSRIWRPNRDGYVFLPWIAGDSDTPEQRRRNYHEGRAFLWPRDRDAILAHVQAHQRDDLYFCPNLFNGKRRNEELVYAEMSLYADLDQVDPRQLNVDRRPTIAWESSPGRFQGVWLLSGMREGATWPGRENQRLTYELGADLSGWDATQLLRVPGKPNYKHEYKEQRDGNPAPGRLLWDNGPRYQWDDFDDLPEVGVVDGDELLDDELLEGIDRHEVWSRVRMRCSPTVRRYMAARSETDAEDADRSDVLWQIERDLADAGCTLAEIVAIVRPTVWNKYRGRADEIRRLKTEAAKAIGASKEEDTSGALEVVETPKPTEVTTVTDLFRQNIPRPRWLIRDIWPEGNCGFIAGAPKSYKSWIALDLAVSLATGAPFLGRFPLVGKRRNVLYLMQEDGKSLVRDRLESVIDGKAPREHPDGHLRWGREFDEADTERDVLWWCPPHRRAMDHLEMEIRTGFVASDEGWQSWLDERIAARRLDAVIVDTLFTSAGDLDLDKSQEMTTRMLDPLKSLSAKHNCAVIIVHHNKKDSGNGKLDDSDVLAHLSSRAGKDMLGSQALFAWVDTALYVRARRAVDRVSGLAIEIRKEETGAGDDVGGVGPESVFLGIPGTEVFVERESKVAEEIRFRVGIPRMSRGSSVTPTGASDHWAPQVADGWRSESEGEDGGSTRGGAGKDVRGGGRSVQWGGRGRRVDLVDQLKEMGVTETRGRTKEQIAEVLDRAPRTVGKNLGAGVHDGLVRKGDDGLWYLTREALEDR